MNRNVFNNGIARLAKAFRDKEIDGEFMFEYMKDMDDRSFLRGVDWVIINADAVNRSTNLIAVIRKHGQPQKESAEEAWARVCGAARSRGFVRGHGFNDELMIRAINAAGWHDICYSDESHLPFVKNHFIKAYDSILKDISHKETFKIADSMAKGLINGIVGALGAQSLIVGHPGANGGHLKRTTDD